MKDKDKKIALTLLALLLYALFVWFGINYEPAGPVSIGSALNDITGNVLSVHSTAVYNTSGSGPSTYLKTLGLTVYTDAEFSAIGGGGGRIFTHKPKMTLLAYMPTPQGDAIVWHDGREGYVCIDYLGMLANNQSDMKQVYIDMCRVYDFQLYIAGNESRSIAYAPKKSTVDTYKKQTGKTFDHISGTMSLFISNVEKL